MSSLTLRHGFLSHRLFHASRVLRQSVPLAAIKQLRSQTGAPINAVKRALEEHDGDIDAAIDHLRKMGATLLAKKAHRDTTQGLISVHVSPAGDRAAMVELNSETDFVARTSQFAHLISSITQAAFHEHIPEETPLSVIDPQQLLRNDELAEKLSSTATALGENIVLKRASVLQADRIFGYVHGRVAENAGSIGVLAALSGSNVADIGPRIAMHIAAAAPAYGRVADIPEADVEKERTLLMDAARQQGDKPEHVLRKMTEGRLKKWYKDVVLEEQEMLAEGSYDGKPRSVAQALKSETGDAEITHFVRFMVGESV